METNAQAAVSSLHANTTALIQNVAALGNSFAEGSLSAALDSQMEQFWAKQRSINDRHLDLNFTVAVLAQTKSGKSTFINAVVGAPLLPSNNVPETARMCRLKHNPFMAQPVLHGVGDSPDVMGEKAIRSHIEALNLEVRKRRQSAASDEQVLDIEVSMTALQGATSDLNSAVSFSLLDTPGPNEAGEEKLKHAVERLLDGVDAVIYVLDFTKLKTVSEAALFEQIKSINPKLVDRLSERLHFVVNKADVGTVCEGMGPEETREYVAKLLNRQMSTDSFQMDASQVLLISARDAFLARLVLRSQPMEDKALKMFKQIAFGRASKKVSEAEMREEAESMLKGSGVPELESRVLNFLTSNAASIKLSAILDDLTHLLHLVGNGCAAGTAALETDMSALQSDIDAMQAKLAATLARFQDAQEDCAAIETEVVDEVRERLQFLKQTLASRISEVLAEVEAPPPSNSRWHSVWEKARSIVTRQAAAEPNYLQEKLKELHDSIFASIDDEVRDFWYQLEVSTNGHQVVLLRRLNAHLAELTKEIEDSVCEVLAIEVQPIAISLTPPSAQDFHDTLAHLFAAGVGTRQETRQRQREQTSTNWVSRYSNGLCRTGVYYVGVPTTEMVTENYEETVFELDADKVREFLTHLVSQVIDKSVLATRTFVRQYLADTIARGQASIQQYAARYTDTMTGALHCVKQGEEARQAALETSRAQSATVHQLLSDAAALQRRAQQLHLSCPLTDSTFEDAVILEPTSHPAASASNDSEIFSESCSGGISEEIGVVAPAGGDVNPFSGLITQPAPVEPLAEAHAPVPELPEVVVVSELVIVEEASEAERGVPQVVPVEPIEQLTPIAAVEDLGPKVTHNAVEVEGGSSAIEAHTEEQNHSDTDQVPSSAHSAASHRSESGDEWMMVLEEDEDKKSEEATGQPDGQGGLPGPSPADVERLRRDLSF